MQNILQKFMHEGWSKIFETADNMQAMFVESVLRENLIECVRLDKRASVYNGLGEIEIFVPDENLPLATIIISNFLHE